jgi:hypothetical protein
MLRFREHSDFPLEHVANIAAAEESSLHRYMDLFSQRNLHAFLALKISCLPRLEESEA